MRGTGKSKIFIGLTDWVNPINPLHVWVLKDCLLREQALKHVRVYSGCC